MGSLNRQAHDMFITAIDQFVIISVFVIIFDVVDGVLDVYVVVAIFYILIFLLTVFVVVVLLFSVLLSVGRFPTSYVRPSLAVMRCLVDSNRPEEWSIPLHSSGTTQKARACNQCEIETMLGNTLTVHMNHK